MTFRKTIPPMFGVGMFGRKKKNGPDKKYANFNRRMMAATIDSVLAMIVLAPIMNYFLTLYAPLPPIDWSAIGAQIPSNATSNEANRIVLMALAEGGYITRWLNNLFLQFVALSAATGLCWYYWSATPGKMLLRMKVVDAKTQAPINLLQIIMRLMGYMISTMVFCLGFFWIGIDKRKQGWHDKLADTVVIIVKRDSAAAVPSDSPAPSKAE